MKKVKVVPVIVLAFFILFACSKENSDSRGAGADVVADKSTVRPGESVSFSVVKSDRNAVARWTVTPGNGVEVSRSVSWDQRNSIRFNEPGTYSVQVELRKVWCDSLAAANPGMDTCLNGGASAGKATAVIQVKN